MKNLIRGVAIGIGIIVIQGALGASDNFNISFTECLIHCGIGMAMIAGAIWIPRITHVHNRKKKSPQGGGNHPRGAKQ